MEGSEPVSADAWRIAELEAQLIALARNGEQDTIQFDRILDRIEALQELMESEPDRLE